MQACEGRGKLAADAQAIRDPHAVSATDLGAGQGGLDAAKASMASAVAAAQTVVDTAAANVATLAAAAAVAHAAIGAQVDKVEADAEALR